MNLAAFFLIYSLNFVLGCLPTNSPDDMTEITTTTEATTTTTTTTAVDCQYCMPVPVDCDAGDSPASPSVCTAVMGTPTKDAMGNCVITTDCMGYGADVAWYKLTSTNMWTADTGTLTATCSDVAGTVGYTDPMGRPITKIGCAEPNVCQFCTANAPMDCDALDRPALPICAIVMATPMPSGVGVCTIDYDCAGYGAAEAYYKLTTTNMWITYAVTQLTATCQDVAGTMGYTDPMGNLITKFGCAE